MFVKRLLALCASLAVLALAGCATPPPDSNAGPPSDQDAYVILGVSPLDMRLEIVDGTVQNGVFKEPFIRMVTPSYMPDDDGYIVMKVKGNTSYAINTAIWTFGRQSVFGDQFFPRGGSLVFEAPAGKVTYVTNLVYRRVIGGMDMSQRPDLEGAQAYLKKHYPQLAGRLQQGRYGFLPLD